MEYCCTIKGTKEKSNYDFWLKDDVEVISDYFEKVKTDNDLSSTKPWSICRASRSCVEICLYGKVLSITLYPEDYDEILVLDNSIRELVLFLFNLCEV